MNLEACRIVLVRPHYAGNLGSAARVMRNMGLRDLALVAPVADPLESQALRMSTHGESILRSATIYPTLAAAIADRTFVAGTSSVHGGLFRKQVAGVPDDVLEEMAADIARLGSPAIVFGPEPSGLTDDEIAQCHRLIVIPTSDEYASLNLAQAVAICAYELRKQALRQVESITHESQPAAPVEMQERAFGQLRESLESIHFLYGDKADALMNGIRHMLRKARLTEAECRMLMGMARQIRWRNSVE
ncbi:MAG: RNA methyltransferase [Gemmataceae bacterium]|nr:RNA methyltransferase [Gemmataceae bacterium]